MPIATARASRFFFPSWGPYRQINPAAEFKNSSTQQLIVLGMLLTVGRRLVGKVKGREGQEDWKETMVQERRDRWSAAGVAVVGLVVNHDLLG